MNPLLNNPFSNLNNNNVPQVNPQIKQLIGMMQGQNPMQMLMNMAKQNPQLKSVVDMLNNGANPEQLVRSICQQRGIDVNQLLSQFKQG